MRGACPVFFLPISCDVSILFPPQSDCEKVGKWDFQSTHGDTHDFAFHLPAHPFSTEPAGAGLGVVKAFYLTTRH